MTTANGSRVSCAGRCLPIPLGRLVCVVTVAAATTWAPCASLTANRALSHQDLRTLEDLAAIVMNDLEQRLLSRRSA